MNALAREADEGRSKPAIGSGELQASVDPEIPEWGNPALLIGVSSLPEYIGQRGQPGEVKHLSTLRKRKQQRFPE